MPGFGTNPKRSPVGNGIVRDVHGIAVVIGQRKLLIRRGIFTRNLIIVMVVMMVGMTMSVIVVVTMRAETGEMKMRTLGMLGGFSHPGPGMRMRERHALGKLDEDQDGRNNATHHHVRLLRQIFSVYFSR